ncbi:MAG: hypothetical protein ABR585_13710 [Gemmatimonadaceae bacterium]
MKLDYGPETSEGAETVTLGQTSSSGGQKVRMSDAMSKYGSDMDALNHESKNSGWGDLFETVKVPAQP